MKCFHLLVVCACLLPSFAVSGTAHAWPVEFTLRRLDVEAIFDSGEVYDALNGTPIDSIKHLGDHFYAIAAEACEIQVAIDYSIDSSVPGGPTSITPRLVSQGMGCRPDNNENKTLEQLTDEG